MLSSQVNFKIIENICLNLIYIIFSFVALIQGKIPLKDDAFTASAQKARFIGGKAILYLPHIIFI